MSLLLNEKIKTVAQKITADTGETLVAAPNQLNTSVDASMGHTPQRGKAAGKGHNPLLDSDDNTDSLSPDAANNDLLALNQPLLTQSALADTPQAVSTESAALVQPAASTSIFSMSVGDAVAASTVALGITGVTVSQTQGHPPAVIQPVPTPEPLVVPPVPMPPVPTPVVPTPVVPTPVVPTPVVPTPVVPTPVVPTPVPDSIVIASTKVNADNTVMVSGVATANHKVKIDFPDGTSSITTAAADGSYAVTSTHAMTSGAVVASVFDATGSRVSTSATQPVVTINHAPLMDAAHTTATGTVSVGITTTTATGKLVATDVDAGDTQTYSLVSNAGTYGSMSLNASTGVWTYTPNTTLAAVKALAAGDVKTDVFSSTVTDSHGATVTQSISVTINGTNHAPQMTSAATANLASGSTDAAYTAVASDADGTALTYSIVGGADAVLFSIDANTGAVKFIIPPKWAAPNADAGADNVYNLTVQASDGALTASKDVAITVKPTVLTFTFMDGYYDTKTAASDWDFLFASPTTASTLVTVDTATHSVSLTFSANSLDGTAFDPFLAGGAGGIQPAATQFLSRLVSVSDTGSIHSVNNTFFNTAQALHTSNSQSYFSSVSLPQATTIGQDAFSNDTALTSVSLPQVTTVGDSAFYGDPALTSISLPLATSIGPYAFQYDTALASVNLPLLTSIATSTLAYTALTSVSLPLVTNVGENALGSNTALTHVDLPLATTIGVGAFTDDMALPSISLPLATTIGYRAFFNDVALTSVNLPQAKDIGPFAFSVDPESPLLHATLTTISLPKAVTIGEKAFYNSAALTSVYLPLATSIGDSAFAVDRKLISMSLPSATMIGNLVFNNDTALTSVNLPQATTLGSAVFAGDTALTSITLPLPLSHNATVEDFVNNIFTPNTHTTQPLNMTYLLYSPADVTSGAMGYVGANGKTVTDTLAVAPTTSMALSFPANMTTIQYIDVLDLSGNGTKSSAIFADNSVFLHADNHASMASPFIIKGTAADAVTLPTGQFTKGADDGTYTTYTDSTTYVKIMDTIHVTL